MLALLAVFNAALVTAVDVTRFPTVEEATAPAADETVARGEAEVPAEVAPPAKPSAKHLDRGRSLSGQPVEYISCSSALEIYAYRRVMRDCGRYLPDMARGVLKGLCARYKIRWGGGRIRPRPQAAVHGSTHARHHGAASGTERGGMDG